MENTTQTDNTYYLESAPVPKAILHMAVPMAMSMVLDLVYNMINAIFIGQLRDTAMLAAVTLVFPFQIVLMGIGQIFGVGGGTLIARLLGERDYGGVRAASAVNFYLSLASGLLLIPLLIPLADTILSFMGASGAAYGPTREMLLILAAGSPLLIATVALAESLRAEGAAKESMVGMAASVVANMVLDPILIYGLRLGVAGAALATVLANGIAVAYFARYLGAKSRVQSVSPKDFRPTRAMLASILSVGSSALIFSALMVAGALLFNNFSMAHGEAAAAAFGVANRLVQIVEFLGAGLFAGIVPLMAFSYASGDLKRLNGILSTAALWFLIVTAVLGVSMFLLREPIFDVFSRDPRVQEIGYRILSAMLVSALFSGLSSIFTDMFQAFGAGLQANAMALARGAALIPCIILGNLRFGLDGIIWALPAAEIISSLIGAALWFGSRNAIMGLSLEKRRELAQAEA